MTSPCKGKAVAKAAVQTVLQQAEALSAIWATAA